MIAAALRGALSDRARENRVHVVSDLVGGEFPSTKTVLSALSAVTESKKILVVIGRDEDAVWLSLRNVSTVHAIAVDQLNAYDVLVNDEVVFTSVALEAFVAGPAAGKSVKAVATASEAEADSTPETDSFTEPTNAELATEPETASGDELVEPSTEELAAEADGTDVDQEETK
jgi:large subunit ribosomal protein L4